VPLVFEEALLTCIRCVQRHQEISLSALQTLQNMMSSLDLVLCIFGFNLSPSKSKFDKAKEEKKRKEKKQTHQLKTKVILGILYIRGFF